MYWIRTEHKKGLSNHRVVKRLHNSDFSIAKGIRERHICKLRKAVLENNLKYLKPLMENYAPYDDETLLKQITDPYQTLPGFEHLLTPEHVPIQSENPFHPERLIYKNRIGELFRSKAEMNISELLFSLNIPYRYEMKLEIKSDIKYPDFTIKRPGSSEKKYIEYFGMLENEDYEERNFNKINWYLNHGFTQGKDVLFLFENTASGMDMVVIQKQIEMLLSS